MILSRDNRHMSRDKCFLLETMSHGTATFSLKYKNRSECIFSVMDFLDSEQYRKILHTCIPLIYMAIYGDNR